MLFNLAERTIFCCESFMERFHENHSWAVRRRNIDILKRNRVAALQAVKIHPIYG